MIQAPNRVPDFVKPEGRIFLRWPEGVLESFPSGTQEVCCPPVRLHWRMVEPGDYHASTTTETWREGRHDRGRVTLKFTLPKERATSAMEEGSERPLAIGTAFLLHGYGVDLETMFPWALHLADAGWRCVLVDLPGHGRSGGTTVHFGAVETNELVALRIAMERAGTIHGPYVTVGHSLGGALALRWQRVDPAVKASVALGAPAEFVPAAGRLRDEYARWLPRGWVRRAAERVPDLLGVAPETLDTTAALEGGTVRGMLVAGAGDVVTPPEDSQAIRVRLSEGSAFLIVGPTTHEILPYRFDQHGAAVCDWLAAAIQADQATAGGVSSGRREGRRH